MRYILQHAQWCLALGHPTKRQKSPLLLSACCCGLWFLQEKVHILHCINTVSTVVTSPADLNHSVVCESTQATFDSSIGSGASPVFTFLVQKQVDEQGMLPSHCRGQASPISPVLHLWFHSTTTSASKPHFHHSCSKHHLHVLLSHLRGFLCKMSHEGCSLLPGILPRAGIPPFLGSSVLSAAGTARPPAHPPAQGCNGEPLTIQVAVPSCCPLPSPNSEW